MSYVDNYMEAYFAALQRLMTPDEYYEMVMGETREQTERRSCRDALEEHGRPHGYGGIVWP